MWITDNQLKLNIKSIEEDIKITRSLTVVEITKQIESTMSGKYAPGHVVSNSVTFWHVWNSDEPVQPPVKLRNSKLC